MQKTILAAEPLYPLLTELLSEGARLVVASSPAPEVLCREIHGADALVVRLARVTPDLIAAGDRLKVIGRTGVGLDNIDVAAATARGVAVVYTPEVNNTSVAEYVVWAALSLARNCVVVDRAVRQGNWGIREQFPRELNGCTFGFVGLGRIGLLAARRCRDAFDATILGYDPYVQPSALASVGGSVLDSLDALLRRSDVISLHVPLVPQTRGMIGARELALMKRTAYLVNASRGGVVDEDALVEALRNGTIAGAAVDVFAMEPLPASQPLCTLPNAILSPHVAGLTDGSVERTSRTLAADVLAVLEGGMPRYAANPEVLR